MLTSCFGFYLVLLQRGADPSIRNTDGKTALDLADALSKSVLTGTVMCHFCLFACSRLIRYGHVLRIYCVRTIIKSIDYEMEGVKHRGKPNANMEGDS